MSQTRPVRPSQVTLAAWMIMGAAAMVVVTVFDQVAGLRSIENREAIEKFLSEPPGEGLGLTVDSTLQLIRAVSFVAAGCAAAAMILGWQVLRRDKSARLALTLLATPIFLCGLVAGGFFAALVAASSVMLWSQPARDWFDGVVRRPVAPPPADLFAGPPADPSAPAGEPAGEPALEPALSARPSLPGFGEPLLQRRPDQVTWAALLTWIVSTLTLIVLGGSAWVLARDPDAVLAEARKQQPSMAEAGVTDEMLISVVAVLFSLLAIWAIAVIVVGVFVWRGREWARITLIVSSFVAGVVGLLGLLMGGITFPLVVACGIVLRMLFSPAALAWCRRRRGVMD